MVLKFTQNTHVYAVVLYFDFKINQDKYRYTPYCLNYCQYCINAWSHLVAGKTAL